MGTGAMEGHERMRRNNVYEENGRPGSWTRRFEMSGICPVPGFAALNGSAKLPISLWKSRKK